MTYITVYNLSINSNYRILAAELNYRFTLILNIKLIRSNLNSEFVLTVQTVTETLKFLQRPISKIYIFYSHF